MNRVGIQLVGGPADGRLLVIPGDPANPPRVYDGLIYEMGRRRLIYRRADGRGVLGRRTPGAEGSPWRYQYEGDRPVRPDEDGPDCRRCGKPSGKWWLIDAGTDAEHRMLCPDCDAAATQQMLRLPERPAGSEEKTA